MAPRKPRTPAPAKPRRSTTQEDIENTDELPTDPALRRPGRPRGRNRRPLPKAQRNKRNNYYEKQRRDSHRDLYNEIAESLGIDKKMTINNILEAAAKRFRETEKLEDLQRINEKLQDQITVLMGRFGDDVDMSQLGSDSDDDEVSLPPAKRRKIYDSGIEDGASTSTASASVETTPERQEEFKAELSPDYSYEVESEIIPQLEEICNLIPNGVYEALEYDTVPPQLEWPLEPLPEEAQASLADYNFPEL